MPESPADQNDSTRESIRQTVISGSEYERLRLAGNVVVPIPLDRKVLAYAGLLFALATTYPMALLFSPPVRGLFPGSTPATASPSVVYLALFGLCFEVLAGAVTAVIPSRVGAVENTRRNAIHYVALENVATVLGFGTGGLAVGLTVGFFLANLAGPGAAMRLYAALDGRAYAPAAIGVSVRLAAAVAFVLGVGLLAASVAMRPGTGTDGAGQ